MPERFCNLPGAFYAQRCEGDNEDAPFLVFYSKVCGDIPPTCWEKSIEYQISLLKALCPSVPPRISFPSHRSERFYLGSFIFHHFRVDNEVAINILPQRRGVHYSRQRLSINPIKSGNIEKLLDLQKNLIPSLLNLGGCLGKQLNLPGLFDAPLNSYA